MARLRPSTVIIALVMLFYAGLSGEQFRGMDGRSGWRSFLRSDVRGYHGYLRSVFITHDLGHEPYVKEFVQRTPDGTLNKCFAGESVMMAPFFLAAHVWAKMTGELTDGFSKPYSAGIAIAGLVYALLGLLALRALWTALGVSDRSIAWAIGALGFGTQLAMYTGFQPGWTHVYSFCAISVFLWSIHRARTSDRIASRLVAGALLGLIVLIRPVNGLVVLAIPAVLGAGWLQWLKAQFTWRAVLAVLLPCLAIAFIQPLLWHVQTGHWFEWGYRGEGFYWGRPMFLQVLFGIRRGLFVWTPVLIACAWCLILLWRYDRTRAIAILVYGTAVTYVIGCWWIWYYGSGFGHRAFVDHYPMLLLPLVLVLDRLPRIHRVTLFTFIGLVSVFHLAQFWQYRFGILHEVSMDRGSYAFTFMRFGDNYRDVLGGNDQEPPYHPNGMEERASITCDLESACTGWNNLNIIEQPGAPSGSHVTSIDTAAEWGPTIIFPAGSVPADHRGHLVIDFDRFEPKARSSFGTSAVVNVATPEQDATYYEAVRMDPIPGTVDGEWKHVHYEIPIPEPVKATDEVRFFLWNQEHGQFLVDDLKATLYSVNAY